MTFRSVFLLVLLLALVAAHLKASCGVLEGAALRVAVALAVAGLKEGPVDAALGCGRWWRRRGGGMEFCSFWQRE